MLINLLHKDTQAHLFFSKNCPLFAKKNQFYDLNFIDKLLRPFSRKLLPGITTLFERKFSF